MSQYQPRVSGNEKNGFYTLVVRIDKDGQENVLNGYKGRHFATREAGVKSANKYIQKCFS